jgi:hypothetical protein
MLFQQLFDGHLQFFGRRLGVRHQRIQCCQLAQPLVFRAIPPTFQQYRSARRGHGPRLLEQFLQDADTRLIDRFEPICISARGGRRVMQHQGNGLGQQIATPDTDPTAPGPRGFRPVVCGFCRRGAQQ